MPKDKYGKIDFIVSVQDVGNVLVFQKITPSYIYEKQKMLSWEHIISPTDQAVLSNHKNVLVIKEGGDCYYIKDTEVPLIESREETNLVGETYISSAEEIEGYILTKPETEEYVFTEEPQVVIYYYEKIKVRVNTKVEGIGGTITGDEDVNYGDDSTKDKIIIKPDEGYVLGSVIINGEELELSEKDKYGLVLENFHEMKEDMNIVVKFEKVEENPNTGSFINYIVLISVPLSLGIFKFIKNKKKLIKL